jgi:tetraacyldisaccharide 4'-kinase
MRGVLVPFSWLYRAGTGLRNTAYDRAWLVERELSRPVISVGNLTVGGTGKTPMVIYLADKLRSMGKKPAILSRGYGRKSHGMVVVSDGKKPPLSYTQGGDEPVLMARRLRKTPVVVDKVRLRGGIYLVEHFQPHVIILDDGFQCRGLSRDLDFVLLDAEHPFSNNHMLPAGWLREPPANLKRADAIVFTRASEERPSQVSIDRVRFYTDAPVLKAIHEPGEWVSLTGNQKRKSEKFATSKPLLVSGIAKPKDFEQTVRSLHINPVAHLSFPDHQIYGSKELERIAGLYRALRADTILTTEKDLVKLPALLVSLNVWALTISIKIIEGEVELDRLLSECFASKGDAEKNKKSA